MLLLLPFLIEQRRNTILLTVEFKFHSSTTPETFSIFAHRSTIQTPLLDIARKSIEERKRAKSRKDNIAVPSWAIEFICPEDDDPQPNPPHFIMKATHTDLMYPKSSGLKYYKLDPTKPLHTVLEGTHFVEFPTIDVWEEFNGTLIDQDGNIDMRSPPKRRRLNPKKGRKEIQGLLEGYGSSGEEDGKTRAAGFASLEGYATSDDEGDKMEAVDDSDEEDDVEVASLEPDALLSILQQVQGQRAGDDDDDDIPDWGDSEHGE